MLQNRIIPALTVANSALVKTTNFKKPKYIGDPLNAVRIFNEKEVDEIMLIDINASKECLEPDYNLIKNISGECLMPLSYGGGIKNIHQAKKIFALGVEKICIQKAAFENPSLISELVDNFGSQSIILSIDIKRDILKRPRIFDYINKSRLKYNWIENIKSLIELGVGELLINSVDRDGLMKGPDYDIVSKLRKNINLPIIALGGVSSINDMRLLIRAGASAVAAGSFFTFYGPHKAVLLTYPKYEEIQKLF